MHEKGLNWRQGVAMITSGLIFAAAVIWMMYAPVPYAVQSPGPTIDTLGEYREIQLISVDGAPIYPDEDGELRLTTVVAAGGPGYPVTAAQVIRGWASSSSTVLPSELLYPPEVSREEMDANAQQQMSRSQHDATILALAELGIDVPVELVVSGTDPHADSHRVVREGDTITGLSTPQTGRMDIEVYPDLARTLADTPPETTITLHLIRSGEPLDVEVRTSDDGYGGSVIGVFLAPDFDMPFDVEIELEKVGGPSAGTMFALGIIDLLSPDPLVGDHIVAGTGTISLNGRVGPIGGIRQKMYGALRDGAEYFLAPGENCDQVVGHIPTGLTVLRVDTLEDAVRAAGAIREGAVDGLPTCTADV